MKHFRAFLAAGLMLALPPGARAIICNTDTANLPDCYKPGSEPEEGPESPKETQNVYPDGFVGPIPPGACYASKCPLEGIDPLTGQTPGSNLNSSSDPCTPWRIPCAAPAPEGIDPGDGLTRPPPGKYIQKTPGGEFLCDASVCMKCEISLECQGMQAKEKEAQEKLKAEEERKKKEEKDKADADRLAKEAKAEQDRKSQCLNCRDPGPGITASNNPGSSNPPGGPPGAGNDPEDDPGGDSLDPDSYGDKVDSYSNGPALGFEIAGVGGTAGAGADKSGSLGDPLGAAEPIGGGTFQQIIDTSRNLRGGGDPDSAAGSLSRMNEAGKQAVGGEGDSGLENLLNKFRRLWNESGDAPAASPDNIKPVPYRAVRNDRS